MLRTRSPLIPEPKPRSPFDLHVLSAPPAFVLSQDQTLRRDPDLPPKPEGPLDQPCSVPESTGCKRHLEPALSGRPLPGGIWNVRTETRRTAPRSDEALAFTRCSVLKVRTAHVSPRGKGDSHGCAPTGDSSSIDCAVNRRAEAGRSRRLAPERSPDRDDLGEPPPPDLPDGSHELGTLSLFECDPLTGLGFPVHPDAPLGE